MKFSPVKFNVYLTLFFIELTNVQMGKLQFILSHSFIFPTQTPFKFQPQIGFINETLNPQNPEIEFSKSVSCALFCVCVCVRALCSIRMLMGKFYAWKLFGLKNGANIDEMILLLMTMTLFSRSLL